MLLPNFLGPHAKEKMREKRKYKKIKNIGKPKKYISEKRKPECPENSQRLVEEDKKYKK